MRKNSFELKADRIKTEVNKGFSLKDQRVFPDMDQKEGKLYVCGTPIGNLKDITLRCLEILKTVDLIAAEDTRHTKKLLNHYQIQNKLTSYYEYNKESKSEYIINCLKNGLNIALVSDAGMPGICDPGYEIINLAIQNYLQIIPIPGVSAVTTALSVSGLNTNHFIFCGFIPKKRKEKEKYFFEIAQGKKTMVFYDSPRRIKETLLIMLKIFGNRHVVVARELTKVYEELIRGSLNEVWDQLNQRDIRGEITIVLDGATGENDKTRDSCTLEETNVQIEKKIIFYLKKGYRNKEIVSLISQEFNVSKNPVYEKVLSIKRIKE